MRSTTIAALVLVALISGTAGATGASLITGKQIKNHSIHSIDLAADAQGADGQDGAPGADGKAGIATITRITGPAVPQCAVTQGNCAVISAQADCPAGQVAISGGYTGGSIDNGIGFIGPSGAGWGLVDTNNSNFPGTIRMFVLCAAGPGLSVVNARSTAPQEAAYRQALKAR